KGSLSCSSSPGGKEGAGKGPMRVCHTSFLTSASLRLDQSLFDHGLDGAVERFQGLIDVGLGVYTGEHAAAARHQVHAAHLQGLTKAILHGRRDVLQGV